MRTPSILCALLLNACLEPGKTVLGDDSVDRVDSARDGDPGAEGEPWTPTTVEFIANFAWDGDSIVGSYTAGEGGDYVPPELQGEFRDDSGYRCTWNSELEGAGDASLDLEGQLAAWAVSAMDAATGCNLDEASASRLMEEAWSIGLGELSDEVESALESQASGEAGRDNWEEIKGGFAGALIAPSGATGVPAYAAAEWLDSDLRPDTDEEGGTRSVDFSSLDEAPAPALFHLNTVGPQDAALLGL